jgi:hypothetical protein
MGSRSNTERSPENLFDELLAVAHTNKRFKRRESGAFIVVTHEDEAVRLSDTRAFEGSDDTWLMEDWPTPVLTESYKFSARQYPIAIGKATRNLIDLTYSYEATLENTTMPLHIAEESYGLVGIKAIEKAGPSNIVHAVEISIDNDDFELVVDESVTYADQEDDQIARTCTCEIPDTFDNGFQNVVFKRDFLLDSDDEAESQSQPITLVASTQFNSQAPRKLQSAENPDEFNGDEFFALLKMQEEMTKDKSIRELELAYNVLRSMRKTFKRQLGLQFPNPVSKKQ